MMMHPPLRRSRGSTTAVLVLAFILTINLSGGFQQQLLPSRHHFRTQQSTTNTPRHESLLRLSLAKKRSAPHKTAKGSATKSKKKRAVSKKASPSPAKATAPSPSPPTEKTSQSRQPRPPPWQVLSQKDAKKNVESEKKRRERIQQGLPEAEEEQVVKEVSKDFLNHADKSFLSWKRFNPASMSSGMRYVASVLDRKVLPRIGVPEIAFLGRSNVGKSSLLNRLSSFSKKEAGFTDSARVGKTPGATASVNLYAFYDKKERPLLGFVDLPGFGYAKLSKDIKESVQQTAERYLGSRQELVLGILLVDIRRVPMEDDRIVLAALYDMGVPIVVVATKVDKVNKNELEGQLQGIRDGLGLPDGQPLCVSSVTGEGTKALWNVIMEGAEIGVEEYREKFTRGEPKDEDFEEGNSLEEEEEFFEDDEEAYYDQGYDWIQSGAGLDEETYDDDEDMYLDEDDFDYDEEPAHNLHDNNDNYEQDGTRKETLKELKKRAKRLERDKEV